MAEDLVPVETEARVDEERGTGRPAVFGVGAGFDVIAIVDGRAGKRGLAIERGVLAIDEDGAARKLLSVGDAVGIGADVTLLDRDPGRLRSFEERYPERIRTLVSDAAALENSVLRADLVIGAVYAHGRRAPKLISADMVGRMRRGAAIVDVAIDQGGIAETSTVTSHVAPFILNQGIVHYGVANMPGAVARTSTEALEAATLPYLLRLAGLGPRGAFEGDPGFAAGLNLTAGHICHRGLAEDLGQAATDWKEVVPR